MLRTAGAVTIITTSWVLIEWLFFVTKPSFLSQYSSMEQFGLLGGAALVLSLAMLALTVPFWAAAAGARSLGLNGRWLSLVSLFPALLLAAAAIIVAFDNFTLTLFGWGVRNVDCLWIIVFRVATIIVFLWIFERIHRVSRISFE